jgi:hypothetical protein
VTCLVGKSRGRGSARTSGAAVRRAEPVGPARGGPPRQALHRWWSDTASLALPPPEVASIPSSVVGGLAVGWGRRLCSRASSARPRTARRGRGCARRGVVVASGAGTVVEVGGPGVGAAGVAGEVGDRVVELLVAGPAEADGSQLAGLAGRGCRTGQAGQRFGGGETGAAVADLGEQAGCADAPGAGQADQRIRGAKVFPWRRLRRLARTPWRRPPSVLFVRQRSCCFAGARWRAVSSSCSYW